MISFRKYIVTFLFLCPALVYAQAELYEFVSPITSESNDILESLFGDINGLLGLGALKDSIMGSIFRLLNVAIALFACSISSITIVQGVVQTASQGVFMGKKGAQSNFFTAFRSISGLVLVMPVYGGYSILQYMVMSIVISGTTLASSISGGILNQVVISNPTTHIAGALGIQTDQTISRFQEAVSNSSLTNASVDVFYKTLTKAATCAYFDSANARAVAVDDGINITFLSADGSGSSCSEFTILSNLKDTDKKQQYQGQIQLMLNSIRNVFLVEEVRLNAKSLSDTNIESLATRIRQLAANNASNFVFLKSQSVSSSLGEFVYDWIKFPWLYQSVSQGYTGATQKELLSGAVRANADAQYHALADSVIPSIARHSFTRVPSEVASQLAEMRLLRTHSLATARTPTLSYAEIRTKAQTAVSELSISELIDFNASETVLSQWSSVPDTSLSTSTDGAFIQNQAVSGPLKAVVRETFNDWFRVFYEEAALLVQNPTAELGKLAALVSSKLTLFMFTISRDVVAEQVQASYNTYWVMFTLETASKSVAAYFGAMLEFWWDMFYCLIPFAPNPSMRQPMCAPTLIPVPFPIFIMINPAWIAQIVLASSGIVQNAITYSILTGVLQATQQTLSLHWMLLTQTAAAFQYFGYIVAAVSPIMVMMNVLSIWVPMLPALTFFIATIGWVLAVCEAMVSVPLVALGMTFPQGHDFLGSAQQTLVLLLSIFIRAPLIVIGYYLGMLILSSGTGAVVVMSKPLFLSILTDSPANITSAIIVISTMVFLIYVTATLMTYSLSASYRIPNMVVRWIGAQAESSSDQQAIQRVYSLLNQQQGSALSSVQQSAMGSQQSAKSISGSVG